MKKKIDKIISLGSACGPALYFKKEHDKDNHIFDYSMTHHDALINMLNTRFYNINHFDDNSLTEGKFRAALYYPYEGFLFGHQKFKKNLHVYDLLNKLTKNFFLLAYEDQSILFVRERFFLGNDGPFEPYFKENIIDRIIQEKDQIEEALKNFGFKNFSFVYIVYTPLRILDGLVSIKEEVIDDNIYFIEKAVDLYNLDCWNEIKDKLNQKFEFK